MTNLFSDLQFGLRMIAKRPGTSLLAVVARVVENIGGVIWVRGAREGGAAFIMLLPVRP